MIKQAIIPLAGLGTRMLPLTGVILKNYFNKREAKYRIYIR